MADLQTYVPIATQTVTVAATSITFSSIPSTYTDLVMVVRGGATVNNLGGLLLQVGNGSVDTGSNYSDTVMGGNGSTTSSTRYSNITAINGGNLFSGVSNLANGGFQWILNFQNYANTSTYKTVLVRYADTAYETTAMVGLWRNTAAINAITASISSTTFEAGSTFTLYGIKAA